MPTVIKVDSTILWEKHNVRVDVNVSGIYNIQVCLGGNGWPTPCEVGIYLDADYRQCAIIDWPRPCKPIAFKTDYGDFVFHLDTASDDEIRSANEVNAEFFRDD
jgi:hypothetical protein